MNWSKEAFKKNFKTALRTSNKTAQELCVPLGIKSETIFSTWMNTARKTVPTVEQINIIAKELAVLPSWLAFNAGPKDEREARWLEQIRQRTELQKIIEALPDAAAVPPTSGKPFRTIEPKERAAPPPQADERFDRKRMSFTPRKGFSPIKLFRDMAAGYGGGDNYEVMEEAFIEGNKTTGFTIARVRGDSMLPHFHSGDYILLKDFNAPGYELPQIESVDEKISLQKWQSDTSINNGDIVVVDVGLTEGKTLKRVVYDTLRGADNWKMKIVADNPTEWIPGGWQVGKGDHIKFYGTFMALCEPV